MKNIPQWGILLLVLVVSFPLGQFLDVSMLDYDDIVSPVSELYRQIQVDGYLWTVSFADHSIISHSANKGDLVPMAKHTVAQMVLWPVSFLVEVIC